MTIRSEPDRLIAAFLDEGWDELPDRAYDEVRAEIEHTRQRVVFGPWREQQMSNFAKIALAAAAVVLVGVVAINFLPSLGGTGGPPASTATPTASPTAAPTAEPTAAPTAEPTTTPIVDPLIGGLRTGTYVAHPFAPPNDDIAFTLTVPSNSWDAVDWRSEDGGMSAVAWAGDSEGIAVGFARVDTLNEDPCNWSGAEDDFAFGPSVDDLVAALANTKEAIEGADIRYTMSEPAENISLGGYSGKQVVVTMPADFESRCPEGYVIWNAEGFDPDAMGPENRWTLSILDVDGERVVIMMSDFADSDPDRVQELQSILDSIQITVE
jgi:hypothetical protein